MSKRPLEHLGEFKYEACKVVAEIGCNHMGSLETAKELMLLAKKAGAHYAKFQKRCPKELLTEDQYHKPHPVPTNAYGPTYGAHREFLELTVDQHRELKEHCDEKGHRTLLLSVDVQGLKAVNDNIEHSKGTEVLTEYGEALEAAAEKAANDHFKEQKGVTAFARAYHIGGDEFALVVVAPEASLANKIAEEITAAVAAIEPIVKVTTKRKQIPTMLRVGAGVGAGEGEEIMNVADGAETDVRRAIYMKGFGRMDARGAVIAKNDPKLEGTPNWRVQEFDAKIAAERAKVVEEGKKDVCLLV